MSNGNVTEIYKIPKGTGCSQAALHFTITLSTRTGNHQPKLHGAGSKTKQEGLPRTTRQDSSLLQRVATANLYLVLKSS